MPFGIVGRTGPGLRHAGIVGFWDRSTGRGTFGSEFGVRHCNQKGLYRAYVCYSAATRPSSQITLGRLVIRLLSSPCSDADKRLPPHC